METSVERVDDTTVKLSITVDQSEVKAAFDAAAAKVGAEVRVPGFRPGKVPRKVLESRVGKDALRAEAVQDALPEYYHQAVHAEELDVVSQPEFDFDEFDDGKDATFTATVQVRPEVETPEFAGMQIPHPEWEVTDEEFNEQLDALRERFAELQTVERPVQENDFVTITISGEADGERVEEVSAEDMTYRVNNPDESDSELDRNLIGSETGAVLKFTDTLAEDYPEELQGKEVAFTAIVKEVKERELPEVDDDFAVLASEFETADEMRDGLRSELAGNKLESAQAELRGKVMEEISDLVEVPIPSAMVSDEVQFRLQRIEGQAEQFGMQMSDYLQAVGQTQEQLLEQLEEDARKTVKAQLVVDAIGNDAEVNVEQDDLGEEIGRQAARLGRSPEELAEFMLQPERIGALFSDAFRRKTIDHILEQVQVLSGPPEDAAATEGDDGPAPASNDDSNDDSNDVDDGGTAEQDENDPS